jgi:hypothetical protein
VSVTISPAEAAGQAQVPMIETLQGLGFTAGELTGTHLLNTVVGETAGLTERQQTKLYGQAFTDPTTAERRLTAASQRAQAAVETASGTLAFAEVPRTYHQGGHEPALLVAGVDPDGLVFAGFRHFPGRKRGEAKEIVAQASEAGLRGRASEHGLVGRLLPRGREARRDRLSDVKSALQNGRRPALGHDPSDTVYGQLATLDPDLAFRPAYGGYAPVGFNAAEALLDPAQETTNRMLLIARLASPLARFAFDLKPDKAAALFSMEPVLWQSLASLRPEGSGQAATGLSLSTLLVSARERLAVTETGEAPTLQGIAAVIGAAALAAANPSLRDPLRARLVAYHRRPEPLARPDAEPEEPAKVRLGRWFTQARRDAKAQRLQNDIDYQRSKREYDAAVYAADVRTAEILEYDADHRVIRRDGLSKLHDLIKWKQQSHTDLWTKMMHDDTIASYSMNNVVEAVQNPAYLLTLHSRVQRARRLDIAQKLIFTPAIAVGHGLRHSAVALGHGLRYSSGFVGGAIKVTAASLRRRKADKH